MIANVSSAGALKRAGFGAGKSCRTHFAKARIGSELPAFCFFDQLKCAVLPNVFHLLVVRVRRQLPHFFTRANSLGVSLAGSPLAALIAAVIS